MRWVRWHRPTREGGNRLSGTRCAPCSDCMRGAQVWVCSPVQNPGHVDLGARAPELFGPAQEEGVLLCILIRALVRARIVVVVV